MDERRLERALGQGPPFATRYVAAPFVLDEQASVRGTPSAGRLVLIIGVTALLLAAMVAGLAGLSRIQSEDGPVSNGWVAFARWGSDPSAGPVERDIYLVREGAAAHRIIGSDSDELDQICPAFSPDGTRLAHGEAVGTADTGYGGAALVVSEIDAAGNATESIRIDVAGSFPPPCANWSSDGRRVAFGVPATDPVNPRGTAAGSAVWVVTIETEQVEVLPDLLATDLEWSPVGSDLAIASGQTELRDGGRLLDGSITLYDADSAEVRSLVAPSGVYFLTWSPDGSRIAYQRGRTSDADDQEVWVVEVDGSGEYLIASGFSSLHGIGPVWSPTGDHIVYQRVCATHPSFPADPCSEHHEVVLVTPDGASEVVLPHVQLPASGASGIWFPFRVTWSPDGENLLYTAWVTPSGADVGEPLVNAVISVPIDGTEPAMLHGDSNVSVYGWDALVPTQSWGIQPSGSADATPQATTLSPRDGRGTG